MKVATVVFAILMAVLCQMQEWSHLAGLMIVGLASLLVGATSLFSHLTKRLGDVSYGVYLYSMPMLYLDIKYFHPLFGYRSLSDAIAFAATLALACLSWRYVERPALALKRYASGLTQIPDDMAAAPSSHGT
jgi:peptidoglycan/LPS O-acetylase OafA/YrhL